jgi:hypothetical protein
MKSSIARVAYQHLTRVAHVQPVMEIVNTPHGLEVALIDKLTGDALALLEIDEIQPSGYWIVQAARAFSPHRGEGYGTEAYMAAIKWATEHGGGLVSDDRSSGDAKKARARVQRRGVKVTPGILYKTDKGKTEFGFNLPPGATKEVPAVVMTGRRGPAYPHMRAGAVPGIPSILPPW